MKGVRVMKNVQHIWHVSIENAEIHVIVEEELHVKLSIIDRFVGALKDTQEILTSNASSWVAIQMMNVHWIELVTIENA